MARNNQYQEDKGRLAMLVEKHTGIPKDRVSDFIAQYGAGKMMSCSNQLCSTDTQRRKLTALFEFKTLYETIKLSDNNKQYHIDGVQDAMEYFCNYFADMMDREHVAAIFLNTNHDIIAAKTITIGTLTASLINPRDVLKEALFLNASAAIVAHNHPSGSLTPSADDNKVTDRLTKAFETAGINMLDHIIVAGSDRAVSIVSMDEYIPRHSPDDISQATSAVAENRSKYAMQIEPPRIKDQLAAAARQLALEQKVSDMTKNHDRTERRTEDLTL